MSEREIIRAMKDEEYRLSLTEEQRQELPAHPAGVMEITCEDLNDIAAGAGYTLNTCNIACFGTPKLD